MELKKHTFTYELGSDVYANPNLYVKNADRYDLTNVKIVPQSKGLSKVENHFVNEKRIIWSAEPIPLHWWMEERKFHLILRLKIPRHPMWLQVQVKFM